MVESKMATCIPLLKYSISGPCFFFKKIIDAYISLHLLTTEPLYGVYVVIYLYGVYVVIYLPRSKSCKG